MDARSDAALRLFVIQMFDVRNCSQFVSMDKVKHVLNIFILNTFTEGYKFKTIFVG